MISESDAKRIYPRNTEVIRKGDRMWKSDAGPEIALAESTPGLESSVITARSHRPRVRSEDVELPPLDGVDLGTLYHARVGRDVIVYEARATGWHKRYTEKNAAL